MFLKKSLEKHEIHETALGKSESFKGEGFKTVIGELSHWLLLYKMLRLYRC